MTSAGIILGPALHSQESRAPGFCAEVWLHTTPGRMLLTPPFGGRVWRGYDLRMLARRVSSVIASEEPGDTSSQERSLTSDGSSSALHVWDWSMSWLSRVGSVNRPFVSTPLRRGLGLCRPPHPRLLARGCRFLVSLCSLLGVWRLPPTLVAAQGLGGS